MLRSSRRGPVFLSRPGNFQVEKKSGPQSQGATFGSRSRVSLVAPDFILSSTTKILIAHGQFGTLNTKVLLCNLCGLKRDNPKMENRHHLSAPALWPWTFHPLQTCCLPASLLFWSPVEGFELLVYPKMTQNIRDNKGNCSYYLGCLYSLIDAALLDHLGRLL